MDDTSWLPYSKKNRKDNFFKEINNHETFDRIVEISNSNNDLFDLEFSFVGAKYQDTFIQEEQLKKLLHLQPRFEHISSLKVPVQRLCTRLKHPASSLLRIFMANNGN